MPLAMAAMHTQRIELRTSIAVALARSPMNLANIGHDLNAYSKGRFVLGLGSQIKPHITKRFSMPWHGPAKQMRECIAAMRAIWDCWYKGEQLNYVGEFYQHRLMTPEFTPTNTEYGAPPVLMAAVGPLMMATAAAVADGIIVHSFCTEKHFKEVMLPLLETELAKHSRTLDDFQDQFPVFIASGETEEQLEKEKAAIKYRIGFYASTPAYKTVLDTHCHADHVTSAWLLHEKTGAEIAIAVAAGVQGATRYLEHGEHVNFGGRYLEARETPGHTSGCMSYVLDDESMAFTGDALLIRGCGRTDFQQGDAGRLYR